MKKIVLILIILNSCNSKNDYQAMLENSTWKHCGGSSTIGDILLFNENYLYVKNDSIYHHKDKIALGAVDKIEYYYGERRLMVTDFEGNTARYCEQ